MALVTLINTVNIVNKFNLVTVISVVTIASIPTKCVATASTLLELKFWQIKKLIYLQ